MPSGLSRRARIAVDNGSRRCARLIPYPGSEVWLADIVADLMLSWSGQAIALRSRAEFDVLCVRCAADRRFYVTPRRVTGRRDRV
jgi:hypothetical protein